MRSRPLATAPPPALRAGEDPVAASLRNALLRLEARHLAVDERAPVRAEHARPVGVVLDVLVAHPEARLLTALPPVVVRQMDLAFDARAYDLPACRDRPAEAELDMFARTEPTPIVLPAWLGDG